MARYRSIRALWPLPFRAGIGSLSFAAAIVSAAGMMPAAAASAATGSTTYSATGSGYTVSGRWFHFVQTEVRLPAKALCAQLYKVVHTATFSVAVGLGSADSSAQLIISDQPTSSGCGGYSAEFVNGGTVTAAPFKMAPGDLIQMSVVYAQKSPPINGEHSVSGHLLNMTSGAGSVVGDLANATYTTAQVSGGFGSFTAPKSQFRAFEFTNSAVETYTGHRGTLTGPWTTSQVVMTSTGLSGGTVQASSPVLWNGGRNFGTYVRAAASG